MTFSSTVIAGKGRGTWKVRATPRARTRWGGSPSSRRPSRRIRPALGARVPATRLKSVLFPAPFGPIRPVRLPAATRSDTSWTAAWPPNRRVTCSSSSMAGLGSGSPRLVTPWPPPYHAGHTIASPVRASQPMTRGDAMFETSTRWGLRALAALALALAGASTAAAQCTTTIGVVMSLTGPAGQFGQAGSKAVELAFRDLNEAGGPAGCRLGRRDPGRPEPGHGRRRCRQAARRDQAGAGHPRRHHLVRLDPHPHVGHGPGRRGPDLPGVVVADAHQPRARGQERAAGSSARSPPTRSRAWPRRSTRSTWASGASR